MMVEVFCTSKIGAEAISVSVGSASPVTLGSSLKIGFGLAKTISAWLSTTVPLLITGARVTSNSTTSVSSGSPCAPMLRLPTFTRPVPLVPPRASVPEVSAPAGTLIRLRLPGAKTGGVLRRSISSTMEKDASPTGPLLPT